MLHHLANDCVGHVPQLGTNYDPRSIPSIPEYLKEKELYICNPKLCYLQTIRAGSHRKQTPDDLQGWDDQGTVRMFDTQQVRLPDV